MNRRGVAIFIIIAIIGAVIVGGGVTADTLIRQNLGVGLFDLITAVLESGSTLENSQSLEDVKSQIGIDAYNTYKDQMDSLVALMNTASDNIAVVNSNSEVVDILKTALGSDYKLFMFSYATVGNWTFKVFEWSIGVTDGSITTFTNGMIFDSYNVKIQVEQSVANNILNGNASPEQLTQWVVDKKLKLNPITEVTRVINVLPKVMELVQANMNK